MAVKKEPNSTARDRIGITDKVLSILVDLETQDLVRKSPFFSIDGKEMWGATAIVGIAPKIISL
jgi:hypothetical protein